MDKSMFFLFFRLLSFHFSPFLLLYFAFVFPGFCRFAFWVSISLHFYSCSLQKISEQISLRLFTRFLHKIFTRGLLARSRYKLSDLCTSSLKTSAGMISVRLFTRFAHKIFTIRLLARSLNNLIKEHLPDICTRSLQKVSQDLYRRSPWQDP